MSKSGFYNVRIENDHIAALYQIASLAKIGAAASDSSLNIQGLAEAQESLYALIYEIACDGVDHAERVRDK